MTEVARQSGGVDAAPDHRLIVSCDYGSQSVFGLKEAADDLCEIIWLVDLTEPEMVQMARLMTRMGTVVDIAGSSEQQVIDLLGSAEPTGILNLGDSMSVRLANVAAALGLKFHSAETAGYLSDKFLQRQALRSAGIPAPDFLPLFSKPDEVDLERFTQEVGFPAVLKPRMGNGSRNTYKVHNPAELSHIMTVLGPRQQEDQGMILEGYLTGTDRLVSRFDPIVSVESFVHRGEVRHISVTGRSPFAEPFRETGLVLPSDLSVEDAGEAERTAAAAIVALGIEHGCLHTELKFTPDGPRIIEVNGRIGGGIPQLVRLAGGQKSMLRFAMELALDVPEATDFPVQYSRIGWQRTVPPPVSAHRVDSISGLEKLLDLPGIDQISINRNAGEAVDWRRGLQDYVIQAYGSAGDYDEILTQWALMDQAVDINYQERVGADRTDSLALGAPSGSMQ
jgi:biotin carboxylase